MRDLLSPKQVARALNVSESSVKRWCDKGMIPTQYTAGGHRRISMPAMLEFLRTGHHELVHPEALGLPATSGHTSRVVDRARDQFTDALLIGDELRCLQIAVDLFLAEHGVSVICDDVIAAAFRDIGNRWSLGEAEVYQERRACEITLRVVHELRGLLPKPAKDAPRAIGCAASGDQYNLGTTMVELVMRNARWNATSLGDNLPFSTIASAIRQQQPRLFWLSCSHLMSVEEFLAGYGQLYDEFGASVAFVVGGYALTDEVRRRMKFAAYCDNLQHFEGFLRSLHV